MSTVTLGTSEILARKQAAAAGKRSLEAELDKYSYAALTGDAEAGVKVDELNAGILKLSQALDNLSRAYVTAEKLEAAEQVAAYRSERVERWNEAKTKRDNLLKTLKQYEKAIQSVEAIRAQIKDQMVEVKEPLTYIDRTQGTRFIMNEPGRFTDTELQSSLEFIRARMRQLGNAALDDNHQDGHPDTRAAPGPADLLMKKWSMLDTDVDEAAERVGYDESYLEVTGREKER